MCYLIENGGIAGQECNLRAGSLFLRWDEQMDISVVCYVSWRLCERSLENDERGKKSV